MPDLRDKFLNIISNKFPALKNSELESLASENLLSPFQIKLTKGHLKQAQNFVKEIFHYRLKKESSVHNPGNYSILMSYDFHISETGDLKLIEINTNASFYGLGTIMYEAHGLPQPVMPNPFEKLRQDIKNEFTLFGKSSVSPNVAIIDEEPEKQRLYLEFLLFRELFKSWGWKADIIDYRNLTEKYNFVYNRLTDFYFENSEQLEKMFLGTKTCFSPNPHEYNLLADKERLIEWGKIESPFIDKHLPRSHFLIKENKEMMWNDRKKFFFKPLRSHGAKQTYKGASISRKHFDDIADTNQFIAQEYVAAPELKFQTPEGEQSFKFDLRFYAYMDQVESAVARIYQGQVTNLKTTYGGFAPIIFQD
jgi:hypothetical protein